MVRKSLQIRAMKTLLNWREPVRIFGGHGDDAAQFRFELLTQAIRNCPIASQRFRYILPNGGMVLHRHRVSFDPNFRQNSASLSGRTCPLSISFSRRSTSAISSASVISTPTGGSDPSNDSARKTRCSRGNANTFFSISSIADTLLI